MAARAKGPTLPQDVASFLDEFKGLLRQREYDPRLVSWIDRSGRIEELGDLGLTMNAALKVIETDLQPSHHHRGPEPDDHAPDDGVVFIFRCPITDAGDAYVKIALCFNKSPAGDFRGVIWSFKRWT